MKQTYQLNEAELAAYCRNKGLYVDAVKGWSNQCMMATRAIQHKGFESLAKAKNHAYGGSMSIANWGTHKTKYQIYFMRQVD